MTASNTAVQGFRRALVEFTAERLSLLERHEAGARAVSHYDFNNTYQYVINREEVQLGWLQAALAEFDEALPSRAETLPVPDVPKRKTPQAADFRGVLDDDARTLRAFVERWRPRVEALADARHRKMLEVILGESREHQRLFEQAAGGSEDLLGRRTGGVPRQGSVLPVRWLE